MIWVAPDAQATLPQGDIRLSRLTRALFVIGLAVITGAALACGSQESQAEAPAAAADSTQPAAPPQPAAPVIVKVGSKVGQRVPDFSMQLGDRSTVTSEELVSTGKPVFLYFFATW